MSDKKEKFMDKLKKPFRHSRSTSGASFDESHSHTLHSSKHTDHDHLLTLTLESSGQRKVSSSNEPVVSTPIGNVVTSPPKPHTNPIPRKVSNSHDNDEQLLVRDQPDKDLSHTRDLLNYESSAGLNSPDRQRFRDHTYVQPEQVEDSPSKKGTLDPKRYLQYNDEESINSQNNPSSGSIGVNSYLAAFNKSGDDNASTAAIYGDTKENSPDGSLNPIGKTSENQETGYTGSNLRGEPTTIDDIVNQSEEHKIPQDKQFAPIVTNLRGKQTTLQDIAKQNQEKQEHINSEKQFAPIVTNLRGKQTTLQDIAKQSHENHETVNSEKQFAPIVTNLRGKQTTLQDIAKQNQEKQENINPEKQFAPIVTNLRGKQTSLQDIAKQSHEKQENTNSETEFDPNLANLKGNDTSVQNIAKQYLENHQRTQNFISNAEKTGPGSHSGEVDNEPKKKDQIPSNKPIKGRDLRYVDPSDESDAEGVATGSSDRNIPKNAPFDKSEVENLDRRILETMKQMKGRKGEANTNTDVDSKGVSLDGPSVGSKEIPQVDTHGSATGSSSLIEGAAAFVGLTRPTNQNDSSNPDSSSPTTSERKDVPGTSGYDAKDNASASADQRKDIVDNSIASAVENNVGGSSKSQNDLKPEVSYEELDPSETFEEAEEEEPENPGCLDVIVSVVGTTDNEQATLIAEKAIDQLKDERPDILEGSQELRINYLTGFITDQFGQKVAQVKGFGGPLEGRYVENESKEDPNREYKGLETDNVGPINYTPKTGFLEELSSEANEIDKLTGPSRSAFGGGQANNSPQDKNASKSLDNADSSTPNDGQNSTLSNTQAKDTFVGFSGKRNSLGNTDGSLPPTAGDPKLFGTSLDPNHINDSANSKNLGLTNSRSTINETNKEPIGEPEPSSAECKIPGAFSF